MSAQTGEAAPAGPVSQRIADRARYRIDLLKKQPNPIWIRELKQAARLTRTPAILTGLAILVTLMMASIGGIISIDASPATTGVALFQVFFSLAYFVVTLIGPAVAANSIASEREGRTWEAVLLTGLRPGVIARGKFLAAFTAVGMYIVMLAPVSAMPFLFGGVTATEVVVAFLFLFLIALLSVAFGLAISSKMASLRAAILVTLLLAFPASITAYLSLGVGLSFAAHKAWPGVGDGLPVWLPAAYARAPFDFTYVVCLVVLPVVVVAIPAWFFYEVTIANLTSVTDDRSTGLKRWLLVAAPALSIVAAVATASSTSSRTDCFRFYIAGMSGLALFLLFCVFLFQGDPAGPSRRVRIHWDRDRAGRFHRLLGPGIVKSSVLLLVLGIVAFVPPTATALIVLGQRAFRYGHLPSYQPPEILAFAGYAAAFFLFTVGFGAWLRIRAVSPISARVALAAVLFGVSAGPWVVAAVAGLIASPGGSEEALAIAAPSPFYVIVMIRALDQGDPHSLVAAGVACAAGWGVLGLLFLGAARKRCRAVIHAHEVALAQTDQLLAEEDTAAPPAPG